MTVAQAVAPGGWWRRLAGDPSVEGGLRDPRLSETGLCLGEIARPVVLPLLQDQGSHAINVDDDGTRGDFLLQRGLTLRVLWDDRSGRVSVGRATAVGRPELHVENPSAFVLRVTCAWADG